MDLRQEGFALAIQGAQQPRQMPVASIEHDMGETQPLPPQAMDHAQRHLALGAKFHVLGNASLLATGRIGEPFLGDI